MTLKEVADNVERGGDGEVIVIGKGDRDDERGEEWVYSNFIGEIIREVGLEVDLHESNRSS